MEGIWGVAGRGLSEGRKLDQLSPGDAARRARGRQGPGSRVQLTGPKACRSSEAAVGHPLEYAGVHAHQNAACGVPSSASALFRL